MTAQILQIRDYQFKRAQRAAVNALAKIIDYAEVAKQGGPYSPEVYDVLHDTWGYPATPRADDHHYHGAYLAPEKDPA